jgi:hypothetical protein
MAATAIQPRFSNGQLELMRLFKEDVSEEQLQELRKILANFLLDNVLKEAQKASYEKGYDADFLQKIVSGDV